MDLEHPISDYNSESEPEPELDADVPATNFQNLTTQELCKLALEAFEEVHIRYKNSQSNDKEETFLCLLKMRSKAVMAFTKASITAAEIKKLTLYRGNQLEIHFAFRELEDTATEEMLNREKFLKQFYNTCNCSKHCHDKVRFSYALEIFEEYSRMSKEEWFISLGAVVREMKVPLADKSRNSDSKKASYCWSVNNIKVCKMFFAMIHNASLRQLGRLQDCVKQEVSFKDKRHSNKMISDEVLENIRNFLNNYLS